MKAKKYIIPNLRLGNEVQTLPRQVPWKQVLKNHTAIAGMLLCWLLLFNSVLADDALQDVMRLLAKVQSSEVRYQEEKHLALLDIPLQQSGTLSYIAPDQLIRSLDGGDRFTIHGNQIILEKKSGTETHQLDSLPMIKAFVASFGAVLAGDLETLERYYKISFSGEENNWQLHLLPRDGKLAAYVTDIRLRGSQNRINIMEINETNDDWSRMTLQHE